MCYNDSMNKIRKYLLKHCVGFSYISGKLYGSMICVKGKTCYNINLPYPLYVWMAHLYRTQKILEKKFPFKD